MWLLYCYGLILYVHSRLEHFRMWIFNFVHTSNNSTLQLLYNKITVGNYHCAFFFNKLKKNTLEHYRM